MARTNVREQVKALRELENLDTSLCCIWYINTMKYNDDIPEDDRNERLAEYGEAESPEDQRSARAYASAKQREARAIQRDFYRY